MAAPLSANQFIAALKKEGLVVHEVTVGDKSWRENTRTSPQRPWGPVNGVVMHHTASGSGGIVEYCFKGTAALPGPLCHGVIDKKGEVYLVGHGRCNHAGGGDPDVLNAVVSESYVTNPPHTDKHEGEPGAVDGNTRFYGFECVNQGDGHDPWPAAQYTAMVKAAAAVCRAHGDWTEKSVIGHKEWSDWKSDPKASWTMADFRKDVHACLAKEAGAWGKVSAPPPPAVLTLEQRVARIEKQLGIK